MTFNSVIAVTLRYFIEFGKPAFQLITTCSRIELIDQKSASMTRRSVKLVCVTKFKHSRVYRRVPVYSFTLQLFTYNLSSKFHFTMFWCLASGNLCIAFYSRLRVRCRRKESSRSLSHPLISFSFHFSVMKLLPYEGGAFFWDTVYDGHAGHMIMVMDSAVHSISMFDSGHVFFTHACLWSIFKKPVTLSVFSHHAGSINIQGQIYLTPDCMKRLDIVSLNDASEHAQYPETILNVKCQNLWNVHRLYLGMWRSSNSNLMTFELRTFSPDLKFDECFKRFVVEWEFVESPCSTTDFICSNSQWVQTNQFFFSNSTYHANYSNIWMSNRVFAQRCITWY